MTNATDNLELSEELKEKMLNDNLRYIDLTFKDINDENILTKTMNLIKVLDRRLNDEDEIEFDEIDLIALIGRIFKDVNYSYVDLKLDVKKYLRFYLEEWVTISIMGDF